MKEMNFKACRLKTSKLGPLQGGGGKWLIISLLTLSLSVCMNVFYEYRTHELKQDFAALGWIEMPANEYADHSLIEGWSRSLEKLNIKADAAFIGNSITYGSDFQKYFPSKLIVTLGVSGQRVDAIERRVPTLVAVHPQKVFIMAGINDLHRSSPETVGKRYEKFILEIRKQLPGTQIYIQSILPVREDKESTYKPNDIIDETNAIIKSLAQSNGCTYIDLNHLYKSNTGYLIDSLTIDGVHLKPKAYDRWAKTIEPYIN